MEYYDRFLTPVLKEYLKAFPVVLLLGPRQAGKSTFLKHELKKWFCFDLEDTEHENLIRPDPAFFLKTHLNQVWIDEAQRCPELFQALRVAIDKGRKPGRYVLSGSSNPTLLHSVSESLAGRIGIIKLAPFSFGEQIQTSANQGLLSRILSSLKKGKIHLIKETSSEKKEWKEIENSWLKGCFPSVVLTKEQEFSRRWHDAYIQTYIDRDIREFHGKIPSVRFQKLLSLLGFRQGHILNVSDLARNLMVDAKTVSFYLDLLEESFQILRLQPLTNNLSKRLIRSPKVYLQDSGLCHYLNRIFTVNELELNPLRGTSWEGWIISELYKQNLFLEEPFQFYFWRTQSGSEVDLILQYGQKLIAIEIKLGAKVDSRQLKGLTAFQKDYPNCLHQIVIYSGDRSYQAKENLSWISVHDLA